MLLTKERQEFITHARVTRMDHDEFSKKIAVHYEKAAQANRRETAIEDEINAYSDLDSVCLREEFVRKNALPDLKSRGVRYDRL